jgi:predicted nucleic acid-binding protein
MYLLDTNVISELRKAGSNKADANVIQWAKDKSTTSLFISAITVLEIDMGVL